MLARRLEENDYQLPDAAADKTQKKSKLRLVKKRTLLNTHLRSRCQGLFLLFAVMAMLVTVRSGISASNGYALVNTQQNVTRLEQENERLKIEIAQLKSPQRIKDIATNDLGMEVPQKTYFAGESNR